MLNWGHAATDFSSTVLLGNAQRSTLNVQSPLGNGKEAWPKT